MFFSTVAIASVAALAATATPVKRGFGGRATYYATGLGACGEYNTDSDFIVALNSAQYGGGYPGPECFKQIQISANGKTATATIMDECPTCSYGELDLSPSLFNHFANFDDGVFQMTWDYVNSNNARAVDAAVEPTSSSAEPTVSSSSAWSAPSSSSSVVSSTVEASSSSAEPTATKSHAASSSAVVPTSVSAANTSSSASAAVPTVTALVNGTEFAQIAEAVAQAGQVVIVGASSVNGSTATNGTTVANATIVFQ